jgi:hypothetical protein
MWRAYNLNILKCGVGSLVLFMVDFLYWVCFLWLHFLFGALTWHTSYLNQVMHQTYFAWGNLPWFKKFYSTVLDAYVFALIYTEGIWAQGALGHLVACGAIAKEVRHSSLKLCCCFMQLQIVLAILVMYHRWQWS